MSQVVPAPWHPPKHGLFSTRHMKGHLLHNDRDEAEFILPHGGLYFAYICRRITVPFQRIREAYALGIRKRVIAPRYGRWTLNEGLGRWILELTNPPSLVGGVPYREAVWAMRAHDDCGDADFETYYSPQGVIGWKTARQRRKCHRCGDSFELGPEEEDHLCSYCREKSCFVKFQDLLPGGEFGESVEAAKRSDRKSWGDIRWVREFAAKGSHSSSEFDALCERYGNICLCCRRSKLLVKDHVVPLAQGGTNWIENIQPLCRSCNSLKGKASTDYRKGFALDKGQELVPPFPRKPVCERALKLRPTQRSH